MLLKIIVLHISFILIGDLNIETNYWIRQGDREFGKQNIEESIVHYSRAIEERPKHALGYLKRAIAYRASGQFVKYADDMQKALRLDPQFTKSYLEINKNPSKK